MLSAQLLHWVLVVEGMIVFISLLLIIGFVVGRAFHVAWSLPRYRYARQLYREVMAAQVLSRKDRDWIRRRSFVFKARLLREALSSVTGEQRERLIHWVELSGLLQEIHQHCRSLFWWRRLRGARLLALLGADGRLVVQLLHDPVLQVRQEAAFLAEFGNSSPTVLRLLEILDETSPTRCWWIQDALVRAGDILIEPLAERLQRLEGHDAAKALVVALHLSNGAFLPSTFRLVEDPTPETRALAVRLMGAIGGEAACSLLLQRLGDAEPDVRAAAAHALGRQGYWQGAAALALRMRDPIYLVRWEAALALRSLGAPGMLFLRRTLSDMDAYASDMARYVLDLPQEREVVLAR